MSDNRRPFRPRLRLSPLGGVMLIVIVVIIFLGMSTTLINFNLNETRNLITKVNETASTTKQILVSGNRTNSLINEIRDFQQFVNERDENQTKDLLPIFFDQFNKTDRLANQTDVMVNVTMQMLNSTEQMQGFIDFIGSSFDSEYLIDEVRQYGQSNNTYGNLTMINEKLDALIAALNYSANNATQNSGDSSS